MQIPMRLNYSILSGKTLTLLAGSSIVSPKQDSESTWEWRIKDTNRRGVPLTDEVVQLVGLELEFYHIDPAASQMHA